MEAEEAGLAEVEQAALERRLDLLSLLARRSRSQLALVAQQALQVQTPAIQEATLFFPPLRQVAVAVVAPMVQRLLLAVLAAVGEETAVTPILVALAIPGAIAR